MYIGCYIYQWNNVRLLYWISAYIDDTLYQVNYLLSIISTGGFNLSHSYMWYQIILFTNMCIVFMHISLRRWTLGLSMHILMIFVMKSIMHNAQTGWHICARVVLLSDNVWADFRRIRWNFVSQWASYRIRKIAGCACGEKAGNVFPATDLRGNRYLAIPACITAPASRTCRDACRDRQPAVCGENIPGIPGVCATPNFTYLARGQWQYIEKDFPDLFN